MEKNPLLQIINNERWYPLIHPTESELFAAEILNKALDRIAAKINEQEI